MAIFNKDARRAFSRLSEYMAWGPGKKADIRGAREQKRITQTPPPLKMKLPVGGTLSKIPSPADAIAKDIGIRGKSTAPSIAAPTRRSVADVLDYEGYGMPGEPTPATIGPAPRGEGLPGEYTPLPLLEEAGIPLDVAAGVDWNRIAYALGEAGQAVMGPHQESWQAKLGQTASKMAQQDVYNNYISDLLEGKTPSPQALSILTPEMRTQALMAKMEIRAKETDIKAKEAKLPGEVEAIGVGIKKTRAETEGMLTTDQKISLTREEMKTDIERAKITADGWIKRAEIAAEKVEEEYVITPEIRSRALSYALTEGTRARETLLTVKLDATEAELEAAFDNTVKSALKFHMEFVEGAEVKGVTEGAAKDIGTIGDYEDLSIGDEFTIGGITYKKVGTGSSDYEIIEEK